jgi:hypothetical protein
VTPQAGGPEYMRLCPDGKKKIKPAFPTTSHIIQVATLDIHLTVTQKWLFACLKVLWTDEEGP